jgi:hypothetical protein
MWFLVRLAFWIGIVLLMLPSAPSQETAEPQFDATRALAAAIAAVSDMRQFCARQPDACVVGSEAIVAFGQKTQASANVIYDAITKQANVGGAPLGSSNPKERRQKPSQDTLTLLDRVEPWVDPRPARRSSGRSKLP